MPSSRTNRRIVLAGRPQGRPDASHFRLETDTAPVPGAGEMLLRTLYLSLDPYLRGRMDDGPSYVEPVAVDDVMGGGTVAEVVSSNLADFSPGDRVLCANGWQTYALSDGTGVNKVPADLEPPSLALGVLGMPGFTAWTGLRLLGEPTDGETVVVAAASGAVGSVVGQIARLRGARVVGIAGGDEKCRYVVDELGFDACLDHHADDFAERLADACPHGIDVYFENVGGAVQRAVLPLLNEHARIPLCGLIAHYNDAGLPDGPDRSPLIWRHILVKRLKVQGFIIMDHQHEFPVFQWEMSQWLADGRIRYREDVVDGLEQAPDAFLRMLEGGNFGKLVVKVAEPHSQQ